MIPHAASFQSRAENCPIITDLEEMIQELEEELVTEEERNKRLRNKLRRH